MNRKEAIEHIRNRLFLLNMGTRLTWSLDDRSAVSLVCLEAIGHRHEADGVGELLAAAEKIIKHRARFTFMSLPDTELLAEMAAAFKGLEDAVAQLKKGMPSKPADPTG